ncbi:hypothetical protein ACAW74_17420 [Fibrella sp. WM1]|uniref:hypothetical protein n=1 Tax=Fibrella musci TaxID=3242485 RepID=UPI003520370D
MQITLTSADELSPTQIGALQTLMQQAGFAVDGAYLQNVHLAHSPTIVMAHRDGQLLGFQTYNLYRIQTPFFKGKIPFVFGGLAFQDNQLAGRGLSYRMSRFYMQQTLGRLFFLRRYAFAICTPTPRLIQIMSVQHQLIHFRNGLLTPAIVQFAQQFMRDVRRVNDPIDDQLVVHGKPVEADITATWATSFRASKDDYNKMAFDAGIIRQKGDQFLLTGNYLLLLGRTSALHMVQSFRKFRK